MTSSAQLVITPRDSPAYLDIHLHLYDLTSMHLERGQDQDRLTLRSATKTKVLALRWDDVEVLCCHNNFLVELPPLPVRLRKLFCFRNLLETLPELPPTMQVLNCDHNRLTSLPRLPLGMCQLVCHHNRLTCLPEMPLAMEVLRSDLRALPSEPPEK